MIVDLFQFTRDARSASGEVTLGALSRIDSADPQAPLRWAATGSMAGRHGAPRVDLTVDGDVTLVCQRCLQPMTQKVAVAARLLVAADEASAEALDSDDDYDVVVGSAAFEFDALVEDEVILALPSAPRHRVCPAAAEVVRRAGAPSPFAALAALKTRPTDDGGRGQRDDDATDPG